MSRNVFPSLRTALGFVVIAGAVTAAYGTLVERRAFTLREVTVPVLPPNARPLRVLHLSDLHMAPWQHDKQEWVRGLAHLEPDLVVDTGDNLGHPEGLMGIGAALEAFRGIPGVFVHGSNDYFGPRPKNPLRYFSKSNHSYSNDAQALDTGALNAYFHDLGWASLNNAAHKLTIKGTTIEFFGVDDPHINHDDLSSIPVALEELRENDSDQQTHETGSERDVLTVGVAHAPYQRVLDAFVTNGAQLIFAGHTHGGQVCLPGFGALVTNCDIPRQQVKGLSTWRHGLREAFLNVSAGLGTSIYAPVRFACRPEATLLTLVPVRNSAPARVS